MNSRLPLRARSVGLLLTLLVITTSAQAQKDFRIDAGDKYHRFTATGCGTIPIYNLTNHNLHLTVTDQMHQQYITVFSWNIDTTRYMGLSVVHCLWLWPGLP
jgi:hypothetical protein